MKISIFFFILALSMHTLLAQKYITRNGFIRFFSHTPVEDIEAKNYQVTSITDAATGEMVVKVMMKSFQFQKALMQEHFNEKYVESDKFPNADFKGKIKDWNPDMLQAGKPIEVTVEGDLTIHGVTKKITEKGTLELKNDGKIAARSQLKVRPEDYGIKIPALVRSNIAEIVDVFVEMEYNLLPEKK
jgi:polyisoprenoid-binding protein YceI